MGEADLGASMIEVRSINLQKATLEAEAAQQLATLRLSLSTGAGGTPDNGALGSA